MFYSLFGLWVQSNLPIPGLVALPHAPGPDVQIWLDAMPSWRREIPAAQQRVWYTSPDLDERGEPALTVWTLRAGEGAYFRLLYTDGAEVLIDQAGSIVWATWPATLTLEDMSVYLIGPVWGFLLRLRGIACLHASAIALGDRAIAFLGPAGAGKSTMAAAFAKQGCPVLSDDIVTLADSGGTFLVQPGYPYLRLWPESVNSLYGSPEALPRLTPPEGLYASWDKRYLDLTQEGKFHPLPLPLAAIYILGERRSDLAAPCVEGVSARTALIALIANSYAGRLLDPAMRAREFKVLSQVVSHVPVRRVNPHADPAFLSRLCQVVLDDYQAFLGGATTTLPLAVGIAQKV